MKILYIADDGIGNTVLATPVVTALKEMYPDAEITFGTRGPALKIPNLIEYPQVHRIMDVTKDKFESYYDMVLCSIWHYYYEKREDMPERRYSDSEVFKAPPKMHEIDMNMQLVRQLGYIGDNPKPFCRMTKPKYFEMGDSDGTDIKHIVLVNGCIGSPWERKEWPNDFDFVRELINSDFPWHLYLLGGHREAEKWNRWLENYVDDRIHNFCGLLSVDECAWVMRMCDLTITNDTGLGHVGAAVDAPILSLWGPTTLLKNKPVGSKVTFLMNENLNCLQCQYTGEWDRCKDFKCMSGLSAELVLQKVQELLKI